MKYLKRARAEGINDHEVVSESYMILVIKIFSFDYNEVELFLNCQVLVMSMIRYLHKKIVVSLPIKLII